MRAAAVICVIQTVIIIIYLALATAEPHTAANVASVLLFLLSFVISRYSLYRVKQKIRRKHGIQR